MVVLPSMQILRSRTTVLRVLGMAEVGNTVSDHLLQMATMPQEHKTTALGVPFHSPISYQVDAAAG